MSSGLATEDNDPVKSGLLITIVDLIKNLVLYGYSCYRILGYKGDEEETAVVQVPSGREMPIRFSSKKLRWVPDHVSRRQETVGDFFSADVGSDEDTDDEDDDESNPFRWQTVVWMPPTESRCTSFAAQALVHFYGFPVLVYFFHTYLSFPLFNFSAQVSR